VFVYFLAGVTALSEASGLAWVRLIKARALAYRFLLVKIDASPVMAIIAGAIEAIGAEK
jgi:hypothetical protein